MTDDLIVLRQSDLAMFLGCKRRFYLQWKRHHFPPRNEHRAPNKADIGTFVHHLLALYYKNKLVDNTNGYYQELVTELMLGHEEMPNEIDSEWLDAIQTAALMFSGYPDWVAATGHDVKYTTRAVEHQAEYEILPGVKITGTIDLVQYDEIMGTEVITDHKSQAKLTAPRPNNFQLYTYGWLRWKETGKVPEAAQWQGIVRNKRTAKATPPFFDRWPLTLNERKLMLHELKMHRLVKEILDFLELMDDMGSSGAAAFAPANATGECNWKCNVQQVCDIMDDPDLDWVSFAHEYFPMREEIVADGDDE